MSSSSPRRPRTVRSRQRCRVTSPNAASRLARAPAQHPASSPARPPPAGGRWRRRMKTAAARRRPSRKSVVLPAVAPVFTLPGRARVRAEGLRRRPDVATRLIARLTGPPAIRRVQASTLTGNVLIIFDAPALDLRRLLAVVAEAAASGPMPHDPARPRAEGWHTLTAAGGARRRETSIAPGLAVEEAGARLARFGDNRLPEPRPKSTLEIITGHVMSVPVLVLGVAATLSIVSGAVIDAGVIIAVIGINAVVGYVTERRVERARMSLQNGTLPRALVRREKQDVLVPAASLVVGDVLVLRAGHEIAADARLVEVQALAVDESALTGESLPVSKRPHEVCADDAGLADRVNMIFAGTVVAEGAGLAVATTTLALGVRRMSAQRTLVRRLAAVESLGATTVICADKTGTVTENRMSVYGWHLSGTEYRSPVAEYDARLARALAIGVLCNEAELANGGTEIRGSSTEGALLRAAQHAGFDYEPLRRRFPLLGVRPRQNGENWMATVHHDADRRLIAVQGAPEEVLARATHC